MSTWLIDTPVLKMLATPKAAALQQWCEANDASLYLSAASLTEVSCSINKASAQRAGALREWLDGLSIQFADRIHVVDATIATRAGALMPRLTNVHPRFRSHDAGLIATAEIPGHGLLTRREEVFRSSTQTPLAVI